MYSKNVSNQITVYKTSKRLVEFIDKLIPASPNNYAKIHAGTDETSSTGHKLLSRIGIQILDYSVKDNTTSAKANLTAEDIRIIYEYARKTAFGKLADGIFFSQEKIIAAKTEKGRAPVTKLTMSRMSKGSDGADRRQPIVITIENGTGIPQKNANGGNSMQSHSYNKDSGVSITMTDLDFFRQIDTTYHYIETWELLTAARIYKAAEKVVEEERQQDIT